MAFPGDVVELAESRRLGEPVRAFDAREDFRRAVTWLALLGSAGLLLVVSALYYLVAGPRWAGVCGVLLAAAYLAGVAWIVRGSALRGRGLAVYAFEDGMVRTARRGGPFVHRWDELRSVTMAGVQPRAHRRTRWRFSVTDADGETFLLGDELPGVRELGDALVFDVARHVLPGQLETVREGRTARFGAFTVSWAGVGKDDEVVPWRSVGDVTIGNGLVSVRRQDGPGPLSAMVGEVPNVLVFAELCRRIRVEQAAQSHRRGA